MTVEKVTPELAAQWLEKNKVNRPIKQAEVEKYVRAMKRGDFAATHQGIAFDRYGNLVDGQHRLWAIVLSGITVTLAVMRGVVNAEYLDRGRSRDARDRISVSSGMTPMAKQAKVCELVAESLEIQVEECWRRHKSEIILACDSASRSIRSKVLAAACAVAKIRGCVAPDMAAADRALSGFARPLSSAAVVNTISAVAAGHRFSA